MEVVLFVIHSDEESGGYFAVHKGPMATILTEGDTLEELFANVKESVRAAFDDSTKKVIHFRI